MSTTPSLALVRAAHPRQALVTAATLAAAAAVAGRPLREVALVGGTVLVGQSVLGWADDLADRRRDARHRPEKPLGNESLDPGTVWFAIACAVLLVVPLAVANGREAAAAYLTLLAVSAVGDRLLHATVLSFVPWVVGFALYPVFLAHGGWGGSGTTTPPTPTLVALAAALGLGVHVLLALPGLVHDHEEGERSLPLRLALRTGTPRMLVIASVWTGAVAIAILIAGRTVGLT
ncbi:4-hydroxybenzoate polyprenyltransferase [Nocardioides exalbidus]|uniref:4-hydroxybenzoate polyprenyltransferase n=1 Tax=Nocardioides exalbidus TaxID=402596 RepID=A0A1H4S7I1_9ACTN|nr:UbiA family prenyltransferase [Nocardioides exalbidus]SEC40133.1 4-hydroxybenzoate polyprenyltransferase [Nocardioides exalbidus]